MTDVDVPVQVSENTDVAASGEVVSDPLVAVALSIVPSGAAMAQLSVLTEVHESFVVAPDAIAGGLAMICAAGPPLPDTVDVAVVVAIGGMIETEHIAGVVI